MRTNSDNDGEKREYASSDFPSVVDDYEIIDAEDVSEEKESTSLVPFDPLQRYLMEVNRYPLLTRDEQDEVARRYRETGDPKAAYVLVVSNLRLVVKIAMEYQKSWVTNIMDLIQEGNIGLIQAVKKFDPLKNTQFSYYASFWIKAYILKFILDNWRLVKIGTTQAQRKLFFNLQKEKARLTAQGFKPDAKYLAQLFQVREKDILEMNQRLALPEQSLDHPATEDYRESVKDMIPSPQVSIDQMLVDRETKQRFHEKLKEFHDTLRGKERDIFENRLMAENPATLQQIGERYGITRERTRQLESRLIKKLKDFLQEDGSELSDFHVSSVVD
ncbi:MAG: RNA polymerase factor sigma-32 [Deltaproteobacteria bacterium]|nr:RNA polymerase factor sigma-32 [Deltaproteobacteria bacterium]